MKQSLFSFVLILILSPLFSEAKIWRVSNIPGSGADFSTLAEAAESASVNPGDTLHLEASSTNYTGATIIKKLFILGPGYFLTETPNEKTQWNKNEASIRSRIIFDPGSAGSIITGISFISSANIFINDSLITIERNYFSTSVSYPSIQIAADANSYADGTIIRQNFFRQTNSDCIRSGNASGQAKDVLIHNNIIGGDINFKSNPDNVSAVFINNTFTRTNKLETSNCVYQNNVFRSPNFGIYLDGNVYYNNVLANTAIPEEGGNIQSVDLNTVFVNYNKGGTSPDEGFSSDGRFVLQSGSPASGHGELNGNVVDCGAFGGPAPYILSGMPSIPSIYELTVPAQVNSGSATMNISVSAAGH